MPVPLVTPAQIESAMGFTGSPSDAATLAERVSGQIRGWCGWHIAPSITETITVDGPGGTTLILPTLRLTGIEEIESDGHPIETQEWSQAGIIRCRRWSNRFRGVTATITHGYDTVPAEIAGLAVDVAVRLWTVDSWIRTQQSGGVSTTYAADHSGAGGFLTNEAQVLARYRLPGLS